MEIAELCEKLIRAPELDATKKAVVILWWENKQFPGKEMSSYALAKIMSQHRLGNPNRRVLTRGLSSSPLTFKSKSGFVLKAGADEVVSSWMVDLLGSAVPNVNQSSGYLPEPVWSSTRGYIEKVCFQLNGCFHYGFYDAASVMLRRLVETLIIECYEHLNRENEIKNPQGHYYMLGELVDITLGPSGLNIGRETKAALTNTKKLGDRSAHNRRFNTVKPDLEALRDGTRVAVDDLVNIAALRHK